MYVLGVGRFDGKGDKYEVQVSYYMIFIIYLLLMCCPFPYTQYYGKWVSSMLIKFSKCVYVRVHACVYE